ncbi:multidrug efflux protein [Endozoicomonas sp. OPT23]|uniref:MATE family efflux transporter n=1 Tax=Endozoicomonas sp. OPT23 TaxID=2072845 RepID=UPI00129AA654|nr:MATE family efflux transporter [Endozoicomonas sp. OPT23]MRI32033.1 multidrug efflux protein [Endozoicomonas sp. OPT23]
MESPVSSPSETSKLSQTPIKKLFWHYTLPAIAGMLASGLYVVIDGIFIGQFVGTEALAAMNLAWPVFGVLIGVALMSGMGTGALYSIARGKGGHKKASLILGSSVLLMLFLSVLTGVLLFSFGHWPLLWMGAKDQVLTMGEEYLRIASFGSLAVMLGMALPMIIRNDEHPTLSMSIMAAGAVLNIILDYLFIVILEQGMQGAAIATVIANAATALAALGYFVSDYAKERITRQSLIFNWNISKNILKTGMPSLAMFLYMSFVLFIHNRLFLEYGGVVTLAAFTIVGYVQALFYMLAEGVANGIQPLISFSYGQNNNKNIRETLFMGMKWILSVGFATLAVVNLFPDQIAFIFNSSDSVLQSETSLGLRLHLFTLFLDGFIVVVAAYFQALANYRIATVITMGNMLVQLPLLFILPKLMGVTGVWIALPLSNIALAIVVVYLLMKDLKKRTV